MQVFEEKHGYKALQEKGKARAAEVGIELKKVVSESFFLSQKRKKAKQEREEEWEKRRAWDLHVQKFCSIEQRQKSLDYQYNSYLRR